MRKENHGLRLVSLCVGLASSLLQAKPNVVLFLTDDQGTLDAGCYGAPHLKTPNIDKLAEGGVRFTQAYAHVVCCPARAMIMTGRHPQRGGVNHWTQGNMNTSKGRNLALDEVTLAEVLTRAGYRTALFGKWHLGAHRDHGPRKQGFDEFFGIRNGFIDNYNHHFLHQAGYHDLYEGTTPVRSEGEYFPELIIKRALAFIEENQARPFFLYLPFNIPHYPEQVPEKFEKPFRELKDEALRSYATITYATDFFIGQVVEKLDQIGVLDESVLIFMSDNGHSEETSYRIREENHLSGYPKGHFYGASGAGYTGKWSGCKGEFLEGGIRVPAILRYPPKVPQGETRDQIVTAMDWLPTVMDLCELQAEPSDPKPDGHSLLPLLEDSNRMSGYRGILNFQWHNKWAVRMDEWKLIGVVGSENYRLLRLTDEFPERKNYASERKDILSGMLNVRQAWVSDLRSNSTLNPFR